jgi:hypothetical protein
MRYPTRMVLADNPRHDDMGNCHRKASDDRKLPTTDLVNKQESRNIGDKLTDIDHSGQDKCHIIVDSKSGEKCRCVVDESVDPGELNFDQYSSTWPFIALPAERMESQELPTFA